MPTASSGTFYISAGTDNRILEIKATDLNKHDLYASVGNNFDQIDTKTGAITTLAIVPGAHGLLFVPSSTDHMIADNSSKHFFS